MKRRRNPDIKRHSKTVKRVGGAIAGGIAGSMAGRTGIPIPSQFATIVPVEASPIWPIAGAIAGWFITPKILK